MPGKLRVRVRTLANLLYFDEQGQATCPESGLRYQLRDGFVKCIDLGENEPLPEKLRVAVGSYNNLKSRV
jgi:UDP-2-acetamido-3-amino-2,3-dideoxy-glucuronate N-acetyltransferase